MKLLFYLAAAVVVCSFCLVGSSDAAGLIITLEDFSNPSKEWQQMNDPVMGGQSTGTFSIESKVGHFQGHVAIVDFLKAPGFIKAETKAGGGVSWPDISSCQGIQITAKSATEYNGYRVSFGHSRPPDAMPYTYGYKADISFSKEFSTVQLPFDAFTDKWDAGTGDAVVTCAEDGQYCPDEATKENLYSIAVWAEGVEGDVDVQISQIAAYGCAVSEASATQDAKPSIVPEPVPVSAVEPVPVPAPVVVPEATASATEMGDEIMIEDFANPSYDWGTMNDPVMGGKSTSFLAIEDGVAKFTGTCAIVPFLKAPGFITMVTGGYKQKPNTFPDVSNCSALKIIVQSNVDYKGYRLSFGKDRVPGGRHAMGYKIPLTDVPTEDFGEMILPFSSFSSKWNEGTGDITVSCADDPKFCPSVTSLQNMQTMSFWGEGVEGKVDLEVKTISAVGCASAGNVVAAPVPSPVNVSTEPVPVAMLRPTSASTRFCTMNTMVLLAAFLLGCFVAYCLIGKTTSTRKNGYYDQVKDVDRV